MAGEVVSIPHKVDDTVELVCARCDTVTFSIVTTTVIDKDGEPSERFQHSTGSFAIRVDGDSQPAGPHLPVCVPCGDDPADVINKFENPSN